MHYRGHRRREIGAEIVFEEIIDENFPNQRKETDLQVQEAQRLQKRINPKRTTLIHIVIKMAKIKVKEKILKATKEK